MMSIIFIIWALPIILFIFFIVKSWQNLENLYTGRIDRKNYFLGLIFFLIAFLLLPLGIIYLISWPTSEDASLFLTLYTILGGTQAFYGFSLHVRRFHDLGKSGWLALLLFIPLVNIIFLIQLLFAKGDKKSNRYGEIPSQEAHFFNVIFRD